VECAEWEGSSTVGCSTFKRNVLSGGSSALGCYTVEWNVLSGRVAVQWAAIQLSGMC